MVNNKVIFKLDIYLYFIIFIKLIFSITYFLHIYFSKVNPNSEKGQEIDPKIVFWKERTEFIFIASMSALMIYLFNPWKNEPLFINEETKVLFYVLGWVLLVTANWAVFFKESPIVMDVQKALQ
jgi:hypothetical protein